MRRIAGLATPIAVLSIVAIASAQSAFNVSPVGLGTSQEKKNGAATADSKTVAKTETKTEVSDEYGFKGISDFFNIREANPDVHGGQWASDVYFAWSTTDDGTDDDTYLSPNIKYGITDDIFVQLAVLPLNLGDGDGQGNGDLELKVFWRAMRETETLPAFAAYAETRIPSGEGSSKMDIRLNGVVTKTLFERFRAHFKGYIESANGSRGDAEYNRRNFQWGAGPGFDYQIDDMTIANINYLNRVSNFYGNQNQNILEIGIDRQIVAGHNLKAAVDIGLDDGDETPNFVAKLQWSIAYN
ncbi:MAG: hypothetical protein CHACPFDD_00845 [Phycisphaerae bacterium]|nr:hypothetical protein [Phycisphaerae bacterium]